MALSEEMIFSILLSNSQIKRSSAIILLQGDRYDRVKETVDLFKRGLSDLVVVSGTVSEEEKAGVNGYLLKKTLQSNGIPGGRIILESTSLNTRDQSIEVMSLVELCGWRKIILVASHFHQFRAFLTFLKTMRKASLEIEIFNSPARYPNWFTEPTEWGPTRVDLLEAEFEKIRKYKDDVATFQEGIDYLKWLEART